VINLVLTMSLWGVTLMNYMINAYYPNFYPGDGFQNLIAISTVELIAYIAAGLFFDRMRSKQTTKLFVVAFGICLIGGTGLIATDRNRNPYVNLISNFICKFGIAAAYQNVYNANGLFPLVFASTTFGICCLMGALSAFFSEHVYNL